MDVVLRFVEVCSGGDCFYRLSIGGDRGVYSRSKGTWEGEVVER